MARSRAALASAELALVLSDGARPLTAEDLALLAEARGRCPTVLVRTKADLPGVPCSEPNVAVSAKTGAGLDALSAAVEALLPGDGDEAPGELLTNVRQAEAAQRALDAVCQAAETLGGGVTPDAVLVDVEDALAALGELTGKTVREDVTDRIFSRFCVGK